MLLIVTSNYDGLACSIAYISNILLENPEAETRWYFRYFLGNTHQTWLAYDHNKAPVRHPSHLA